MQGENRFIKLLLFSTAGGKFFFTDSVPQQTSLFDMEAERYQKHTKVLFTHFFFFREGEIF